MFENSIFPLCHCYLPISALTHSLKISDNHWSKEEESIQVLYK